MEQNSKVEKAAYGKDWEKALKSKSKDFLVNFLKNILIENNKLKEWQQSQQVSNAEKEEKSFCACGDEFNENYKGICPNCLAGIKCAYELQLIDWNKLAVIAPPEKWIKMYEHYQEILTKQDVVGWWQDQFDIADKERNELKDKGNAVEEKIRNRIKIISELKEQSIKAYVENSEDREISAHEAAINMVYGMELFFLNDLLPKPPNP